MLFVHIFIHNIEFNRSTQFGVKASRYKNINGQGAVTHIKEKPNTLFNQTEEMENLWNYIYCIIEMRP